MDELILSNLDKTVENVEILAGWCVLLGAGLVVVGVIAIAALAVGLVAVVRKR